MEDHSRIILFSRQLGRNGMTKVIAKEWNGLYELGINSRVITFIDGTPAFYKDLYLNIGVQEIGGSSNTYTKIDPTGSSLTKLTLGNIISALRLMLRIIKVVRISSSEIIIYHEIAPVILSLPFLYLSGTKFAIYLHDNSFSPITGKVGFFSELKNRLLKFLLKNSIRKAKITFCVSPALSNLVRSLTGCENVSFLPLGVDLLNQYKDYKRNEYILTYSFWDRWRKPEIYLEIIERVPHNIQLVLAGGWHDKTYLEEFRSLVVSRGLSKKVIIKPIMTEELKNQLLLKAIAFVRFGFAEQGTPGGVIEALGAGCPVIVNKEVGVASIIQNEKNGFIVSDSSEASKVVSKLVDDESLLRSISENGYLFASQLDWKTHVKRLIESLDIS